MQRRFAAVLFHARLPNVCGSMPCCLQPVYTHCDHYNRDHRDEQLHKHQHSDDLVDFEPASARPIQRDGVPVQPRPSIWTLPRRRNRFVQPRIGLKRLQRAAQPLRQRDDSVLHRRAVRLARPFRWPGRGLFGTRSSTGVAEPFDQIDRHVPCLYNSGQRSIKMVHRCRRAGWCIQLHGSGWRQRRAVCVRKWAGVVPFSGNGLLAKQPPWFRRRLCRSRPAAAHASVHLVCWGFKQHGAVPE